MFGVLIDIARSLMMFAFWPCMRARGLEKDVLSGVAKPLRRRSSTRANAHEDMSGNGLDDGTGGELPKRSMRLA
jgi:hypothetical protein